MSEKVENLVWELIDVDNNVGGVCVINKSGKVVFQTDNWDLKGDADNLLKLNESASSVSILGIRYMIVENVPERIIGTNVTGKGHVIICPAGKGIVVMYIIPTAGPRDALFDAMTFSGKIGALI